MIISTVLLCLIVLYLYIKSPKFQTTGELYYRIPAKEKVVFLTFDDGPQPENTDRILLILEQENVKATFFLTGREISENMVSAVKIAQSGHCIGNHSFSHKRMVFRSPSFIKEEIERTNRLIRQTGYEGPIYFRPPYGKKLILLPYFLKTHNITTLTWDVAPDSHNGNKSEDFIRDTGKNVKPGSIILMHVMYKGREESLNAIKGIIHELKKAGYRFETPDKYLH